MGGEGGLLKGLREREVHCGMPCAGGADHCGMIDSGVLTHGGGSVEWSPSANQETRLL